MTRRRASAIDRAVVDWGPPLAFVVLAVALAKILGRVVSRVFDGGP